MRDYKIVFLLFFVISFLGSKFLVGQIDPAYPSVHPSYSEDFSDYSSFPTMCFENIFLDVQGKMWLKACGTGNQVDIHLFQFDGYNFRLQEGALAKLDVSSVIVDIYKKKFIIGYSNDTDDNYIFKYHIQEESLEVAYLESHQIVQKLLITDEDKIYVLTKSNDYFKIYHYTDDNDLQKHKQIATETSADLDVLFFDQNYIWSISAHKNEIERLNWTNGNREWISINSLGIESDNNGSYKSFEFLMFHEDDTYFLSAINVQKPSNSRILRTNTNQFSFSPFDINYPAFTSFSMFSDDVGQKLYLFSNDQEEHCAILEDTEEKFYDYSPIFKKNEGDRIGFLRSKNFTKEIFGCSEKGLFIDRIRNNNHIEGVLESESIRGIVELNHNKLLIATQDDRKFLFDLQSKTFLTVPSMFHTYNAFKIFADDDKNIWYSNTSSVLKYNYLSESLEVFPTDSISASLFVLSNDQKIYFKGNFLDIYVLDLKTKQVKPFKLEGLNTQMKGFAHDMIYDDNGFIWLATSEGFLKINVEKRTIENLSVTHPELSKRNLSLFQQENGLIWLGTVLNGIQIFNPDTEEVRTIDNTNGLPNNTIASITEDEHGYKWIATYNGLSLLSPSDEVITNFYEEDGIINNEFNRYSNLLTKSGNLILGTIKGFNVIEPQKLKENLQEKDDLKIYTNSITHYNSAQEKQKIFSIDQTESIVLPSTRREFKIEFATSNYFNSKENKFAYKFNRHDQDWIEIGNQPSLHLSNIEPGNHEILIKGSDGKGNWSKSPLSVKLLVKQHFYKTVKFYLILFVIAGLLALLWITRLRTLLRKGTMKIMADKATIERQAEKLKKLNDAKSRFFTNISHEFRTPLTIISGMVEQVRDQPNIWLDKGTEMIKQNTLNLLDLVNQILDLRKLESNSLKLNLVQGDVISYLKYLFELYQVSAKKKEIQMHFLSDMSNLIMDYDPDKILRIISNLLSNAIKFTNPNGNIYFQLNEKKESENRFLTIKIRDTGNGIPEDQLPYIFDRFYQVDDSITRTGEGTGIGLALTKELINLMQGEIAVASTINEGSSFIVKIPIHNTSEKNSAFTSDLNIAYEVPKEVRNKEVIFTKGGKIKNPNLPNLLIVEDSADLVQFLVATLELNYNLSIARNGQEGIAMAISEIPDLIISDVMMPIQDGYQLCNTLKKEPLTSHIPIILLTAKVDSDSKIEGLETGADAYLSKPFEKKELLVRLKKLLELRQKLRTHYLSINSKTKVNNKEDEFLQKLNNLIEDNISDDSFGIPQICRAVGVQRMQLHNKIKALTGLSTSIYIRMIRLKKGKHLLSTTYLNVSEVAYAVGYKDPKYFSRLYIETYNELPSTYKN